MCSFPVMCQEHQLSKYHSSLIIFLVEGKAPRLFVYLSLTVFDREESFFESFLIPYDIFSKCFPFCLYLKSLVLALVQTIFLDPKNSACTVFRAATLFLE